MVRLGAQAALALAALGPTTARQPGPAPQELREAKREVPPRAPPLQSIAGLSGFESVSTLRYASAPDRPHRLRATYVFPDRVRWHLSAGEESRLERHLHYRFGEQVYRVAPRSADSIELADEDRRDVLRQMELRRAVMLWPDGFAWKGDGTERTVDLLALGSLRARFAAGSDAPPVEVSAVDAAGKPIDALRALTWRAVDRRSWPASAELWHAGELVWRETIDSVQTSTRFIDSYFTPGDRRDPVTRGARPGQVHDLEIPETCSLRVALSPGASWDAARAELDRLRTKWSEELKPLELDRASTFELSADGAPTACVLRLAITPKSAPQGFSVVTKRKGRALTVEGLGAATPAALSSLRAGLPRGAAALTAYARFDPREAPGGLVLLVLPFGLAD